MLIRPPAFPSTFSAAALAVSAAIDCEHVDARGRELRNASGPEEKKTLEGQIKNTDDIINRYQADLTNAAGSSSSVSLGFVIAVGGRAPSANYSRRI